MKKFISAFILSAIAIPASAGIITGGDLLDHTDATRLESWLGLGDQNFTNIWDGVTGDSAQSWHSAVDGVANTISIYDVMLGDTRYRIGGYNASAWASSGGYAHNDASFIFNLTDGFMRDQSTPVYSNDVYSTSNDGRYFAIFGGGHDLFGGRSTLGRSRGSARSLTYGSDHRTQNIFGNTCSTSNFYCENQFSVLGLETYTYADTVSVPEPGTLALLGLGLIGLVASRRKTQGYNLQADCT